MKLAKIMRKISLPLVILLGVIFIFFVNTNEGFATCTTANCARSGGTFYNRRCYGFCPRDYLVSSDRAACIFKDGRAAATSVGKPFSLARRVRSDDCR